MAKYRVLVPELSVPRSIGELRDIYGNVVGHSHVNRTYFEGDVLEESDVSPVVQEQVDSGEYTRLEKVSDNVDAGPASAAPITGYNDLSVEQVRGLFDHLPSETINRIKDYEREHENRPEISEYSVGLGEASVDRLQGNVGSERVDATEKTTAEVTTREVGENDVQFGESLTGDGQPDVEPGTAKRREASSDDNSDDSSSAPAPKRARRKAASSGSDSKKDDDSGSSNSNEGNDNS